MASSVGVTDEKVLPLEQFPEKEEVYGQTPPFPEPVEGAPQ